MGKSIPPGFDSVINGHPNPGSADAVGLGCLCPQMDNHHGQGFQWPNDDGVEGRSFWITEGCPLHAAYGIIETPEKENDGD